jgi:ArsR family transcriptional regulator
MPKYVESSVLCCTPMLRQPLPIDEAERLARMFKALGDPIRLRLLSMIASHEGGEACVCELTGGGFSVTGSTISHHLKVLREAGLIEGARRGTWIYYRALPDALGALAAVLQTDKPDRVTG